MLWRLLLIGWLLLLAVRALGRVTWPTTLSWWCRRFTIWRCTVWTTAAEQLLLAAHVLVLGLQRRGSRLDKSILNWPCSLWAEHRPRVHGSGYWFLPCLEHLVHLPPCAIINGGVCVHESRVEAAAKVDCVGGANVLDNRVEEVEGGQFSLRSNLLREIWSEYTAQTAMRRWAIHSRLQTTTYLLNVFLEHFGNAVRVLGVLACNDGQRGDLNARVHSQLAEGIAEVRGHAFRLVFVRHGDVVCVTRFTIFVSLISFFSISCSDAFAASQARA